MVCGSMGSSVPRINDGPSQIRHGMEYVNLCNKDVAPVVSKYVAKIAPYSESLFYANYSELSPAAWWKAGEKMGFNPQLVELAMRIVGYNPASIFVFHAGIYQWKAKRSTRR